MDPDQILFKNRMEMHAPTTFKKTKRLKRHLKT